MTTARDLVNAIQSGKSATIQATFDALMTEKIQGGIEAYRQAVINNTFNPELVSESDEGEEAIDSSINESDLSEYTLEEIQEFMESEEFSALDELSKSTLASYYSKAIGDRHTKELAYDSARRRGDEDSAKKLGDKTFNRSSGLEKAKTKFFAKG